MRRRNRDLPVSFYGCEVKLLVMTYLSLMYYFSKNNLIPQKDHDVYKYHPISGYLLFALNMLKMSDNKNNQSPWNFSYSTTTLTKKLKTTETTYLAISDNALTIFLQDLWEHLLIFSTIFSPKLLNPLVEMAKMHRAFSFFRDTTNSKQ